MPVEYSPFVEYRLSPGHRYSVDAVPPSFSGVTEGGIGRLPPLTLQPPFTRRRVAPRCRTEEAE